MINNHTQLNSPLYTFLSSGAVDVILWEYPKDKLDNKVPPYRSRRSASRWWEYGPSINNKPINIDPDKQSNIYIEDRKTIFLNELFTNTFLVNLELLDTDKTVHINFKTTKQYSFSLQQSGNSKLSFDAVFGIGTENWNKGHINNLEKYFEGLPEDEILIFDIMIHKSNPYRYFIEMFVSPIISYKRFYKITYSPNMGRNSYVDHIIKASGEGYKIKSVKEVYMQPYGLNTLKGWATNKDGIGVIYQPNDEVIFEQNTILYAIWESKL